MFAQQSKVIDLRHADTLKGKILYGEEVQELIGKVYFVQIPTSGGLVKVWCDTAFRFMTQNKIELYGNVKVVRDSVTIRSKEGVYYAERRMMEGKNGVQLERGKTSLTAQNGEYFVDEKRSHFVGDVLLIDTSTTITCNEMNYYEAETRSVAIGNVHVFENTNGVNIYGDSLIHIEQKKFTLVLKQPRLVKIDTSASGIIDTMVVVSHEMQSIQDTTERFVAIDSVRLVKGSMSARCGKATYFVKNDFITLQTHPIIWSDENQITGDSIHVRMEDKRVRSMWVKDRAMTISRVDTALPNRFNQLTGRELTMYFRANKLEQVDVQKNATSLYYLFDNKEPNGANKSSGDRIFIDFVTGEVDRIKIVGGVQGQYLPEKMIIKHEQDYNLDGFRWYENRPIRQGVHIISE
ncbi:MAG: OstA-like protein [Bacteroidota bacterium]|jgi:lipopolysaccharide export system protein LptA